jgi:glycerophosphoryl diester phosphodiesterase
MSGWRTLDGTAPRIIAHRGASGLRPEHTLEGYRLAIEQGADLIEPDLVPSRDGVLFARHERELSRSTDVASRMDWRDASKKIVREHARWFADDFDAERLLQLRAVQPFPARSLAYDGQLALPRFSDVLELAAARWTAGNPLGVYPEIKHPSELMAKGIDSTALLIRDLQDRQLVGSNSPIWVQCFELDPLRRVSEACGNPTFALFERIDAEALNRLRHLAPWLSGVALSKACLIGASAEPELIEQAHALDLQVHVWTLRDDAVMPGFATVQAEYAALFEIGVDALFCDFPAGAVTARQQWRDAHP